MHSTGLTASLLATATFISSTLASPLLTSRAPHAKRESGLGLAVYWGQGPDQDSLATFCQDSTIDIIPIAFVNTFPDESGNNGYPGTNYGNACGSAYWTAPDGTQTKMFKDCTQIAADVQTCQDAGKKILVSLGGGAGTGNTIASASSARDFADFLWGAYGPEQDTTETLYPRPFGSTIVDGFDLDIENGGDSYYSDLVDELRTKFDTYPDKQFYISGAPQCIVPDAHLGSAITNSHFDYVFVQYYNTQQCSASSLFTDGTLDTSTDPSYGWIDWLQENSQNKDVKLYVGLLASTDASGTDGAQYYLDVDEAKSLLTEYACDSDYSSTFGGVMVWEATYSQENQVDGQSYAKNIKSILSGISCSTTSTTTTTTSTTSTSTTTTSTTTTTTTTTTTSTTTTTTSTTTSTVAPSTTTSSSTTSPTTTTTSTSTTSTSSTTSSTTTSSSTNEVGPISATTSSSTTSSTTSSSTTTTTSAAFSVGPISASTTTSSFSWGFLNTTTTVSSSTTTSSGFSVGPIGASTTSSRFWAWTSTSSSPSSTITTTSAAVGPISNSISSSIWTTVISDEYTITWDDWTASTSTTKAVDPTLTSSVNWADWTPTTTSSAAVGPASDYTTTIWVTSYIDVCPTGFTTRLYTLTTTVPVAPASATTTPFVWPTNAEGCPSGFTTTVTTCTTGCAETITVVTVTIPIATTTAVITQTIVPVAPSGAFFEQSSSSSVPPAAPAGSTKTVTGPGAIVVSAAAASSASSAVVVDAVSQAAGAWSSSPAAAVETLSLESVVSPAQTSAAAAANSGWLGVAATGSSGASTSSKSTPVSPAVATYTGAAARNGVSGSALVCLALGVVGVLF